MSHPAADSALPTTSDWRMSRPIDILWEVLHRVGCCCKHWMTSRVCQYTGPTLFGLGHLSLLHPGEHFAKELFLGLDGTLLNTAFQLPAMVTHEQGLLTLVESLATRISRTTTYVNHSTSTYMMCTRHMSCKTNTAYFVRIVLECGVPVFDQSGFVASVLLYIPGHTMGN